MGSYLSSPNSNLAGPFLRKLPLTQEGMRPVMWVGMGLGVSSLVVTRAARLSRPLAWGHLCLLPTAWGEGANGK